MKFCKPGTHKYILLAKSISGIKKYWKCIICGYKTDWNPKE